MNAPQDLPDEAPFTVWMGVVLLSQQPGEVRLQLASRPDLTNRRGVVHGGVLATLMDSAMARAARTLEDGMALGGTIDLHVQYMQPAEGLITATGCILSSTRSLAFCRADVHNDAGVLCATALATMRLRRAG